jgi:AraC-like DNA-binding protein
MASDLRVYGVAAPELADADSPVDHRGRQRDMVTSAPDRRLRRYVSGYIGFTASARLPTIQHALPSAGVPLLLQFDPSPGVLALGGSRLRIPPLPVVGLHNHAVTVHRPGPPHGIAILLTPPGAYALLGIALREIANTYTSMVDLLGERAVSLAEQLADIRNWPGRFALLNRTLGPWLSNNRRQPAATIVRAWQRLQSTDGQLTIAGLADELEVSRSYLDKRFAEQVGLPPKTVARILRFRRAAQLISSSPARLGSIAATCGYSDQAHLDRDFRTLAACTPTEFLARRTLRQPPNTG